MGIQNFQRLTFFLLQHPNKFRAHGFFFSIYHKHFGHYVTINLQQKFWSLPLHYYQFIKNSRVFNDCKNKFIKHGKILHYCCTMACCNAAGLAPGRARVHRRPVETAPGRARSWCPRLAGVPSSPTRASQSWVLGRPFKLGLSCGDGRFKGEGFGCLAQSGKLHL